MKSIDGLSNNGVRVLLLRRTTNDTVKASVGYRGADGEIRGWYASRPPTHYTELPPFAGKGK